MFHTEIALTEKIFPGSLPCTWVTHSHPAADPQHCQYGSALSPISAFSCRKGYLDTLSVMTASS